MTLDNLLKIVIVEDDQSTEETLRGYIKRFSEERNLHFTVTTYSDGKRFLDDYDLSADMIFMDIDLGSVNGMEIVKQLRKRDKNVIVIFVTNLAQYAVEGYSVDALDFIVKPVTYYNFSLKLGRAMVRMSSRRDKTIKIMLKWGGEKYIPVSSITYVEIMNHTLCYHTLKGDFMSLGSMKQLSEQLKGYSFALCNRCYLVNFRYVEGLDQNDVIVNGTRLQISHLKRKEFLQKMNFYLSGDTFTE